MTRGRRAWVCRFYACMQHAVRLVVAGLPLRVCVGSRRVCIRLLVMCSVGDAGKRKGEVTLVLGDALRVVLHAMAQ